MEGAYLVEDFLESRTGGPTAALNAYNKLKWLHNYLKAPLCMRDVEKPSRVAAKGKVHVVQQAEVLEPALLELLEMQALRLHAERDWRAGPTAAAAMMALACVRFKHVQRSVPVARNDAWLEFHAYRGKTPQDGARPAFKWFAPRFGISGTDVGNIVWEAWHCMKNPRAQFIVCYAGTCQALSLQHFHDVIREVLTPHLAQPETAAQVSSYSLRRFVPTLCDVVNADIPQRFAVGGWCDKTVACPPGKPISGRNAMPFRYNGQTEAAEVHGKLWLRLLLFEAAQQSESSNYVNGSNHERKARSGMKRQQRKYQQHRHFKGQKA